MVQNPSPAPEAWQVPECPFAIEYDPDLLDEIRRQAVSALLSLPHGGAEIGGVLFGSREDGRVRLQAHRLIECQYAFGPSFVLSDSDLAGLARLLEGARRDPALAGLAVVGWYHTHTRSGVFLSEQDVEIYNRFFPEAWQVALVVRPYTIEPTRAGFFFREADGRLRAEKCYRELTLRPRRRRTAPRPAAPLPEAPPEPAPAPAPAAEVETAEAPAELPSAPVLLDEPGQPRRLRWLWAVLGLGLVAGGAGILVGTRPLARSAASGPPRLPPALHLAATEEAGQLRIRWDREAPPLASAKSGALEIADGETRTTIPMDASGLRNGTFAYARQSAQVRVRLLLQEPDGHWVEESTGFAAPLPPRPAGPSPAETDLRQENEQLRSQLEKEKQRVEELTREVRIQQELLKQK